MDNNERIIKKLEIGSGSRPREGYIHHDIRQLDDIDIVCDARKFSEDLYGSFDEVYAYHVLEHFNRLEIKEVLAEWIKLLCPGGKIELIVPDVREICRQFVEGFIDIEFFDYLMFGGNDYEYNVHKYGFDATHLGKMLNSLGMEIVSSVEGVKWENRKRDKYCPMVKVVARKAYSSFLFANHELNYFYHRGNCGFPPEPRTERTVELPIADLWLSLAGAEVWEIGAVSCNYWRPIRVEKIIDPFDKHPCVTDRVSMMDMDLTGKKVLSMSTIEHIGKSTYEGCIEEPQNVLKALEKIFQESPCFLITFPPMYNSILDKRVFAGDLPSDVRVRYIIRKEDQSWEEVFDPEQVKIPYGRTRRSDGVSAGADAVVILERGELISKGTNSIGSNISSIDLINSYTKEYYLERMAGYSSFKEEFDIRKYTNLFLSHTLSIAENKSICDLGGGRGELSKFYKLLGSKVVYVDYSKSAIEVAKEFIGKCDNVEYLNIDASQLPMYVKDKFSTVFMNDFVEHVSQTELESILGAVYNSLNNSGVLIVHTPEKYFGSVLTRKAVYPLHINLMDIEELKEVLSRYFEYVDVFTWDGLQKFYEKGKSIELFAIAVKGGVYDPYNIMPKEEEIIIKIDEPGIWKKIYFDISKFSLDKFLLEGVLSCSGDLCESVGQFILEDKNKNIAAFKEFKLASFTQSPLNFLQASEAALPVGLFNPGDVSKLLFRVKTPSVCDGLVTIQSIILKKLENV